MVLNELISQDSKFNYFKRFDIYNLTNFKSKNCKRTQYNKD